MSALAHHLERARLPTAVLSLIREHSLAMRPPRTLWVPFELGRPLGPPGESAFQRRVLTRLLALLEVEGEPVHIDFDEEAPASARPDDGQWVCPVSFPAPAETPRSLGAAVSAEVRGLQPWFELGRERRGRTTVGLADRPIETLVELLERYADSGVVAGTERPAHLELKYALDDLLAYYQEAVTAQPGSLGSSREILRWFWTETHAGRLFTAVRDRALAGEDEGARLVAARLLVPRVMDSVIESAS